MVSAEPMGRKVAVTLIGEHHLVGVEAAGGGGQGGRTSVGGLNPVAVDIIVGEHRASHRGDADSLLFETHLLYHLGHELVDHSVGATGAIVHIIVVNQPGSAVDFVFGAYDFLACHD